VGTLIGNGDGTFQTVVLSDPGGNNSTSLVQADLNGDGKPDVIVANDCGDTPSCSNATVGVLLGNADGTFQSALTYPAGLLYARSVAVDDVNNDGKIDLVVEGDSSSLAVLLGNGNGTFQAPVSYSTGGDGAASSQALHIADVNGDGWLDLVTSNSSANSVGVLMNNLGPHSATTAVLTSDRNPAFANQMVTYRATVSNQTNGPVTGAVTFMDGGARVATATLEENRASYTVRYQNVGSHSISVVYLGDADNDGSTSNTLTEYVRAVSATTLTTSGSPTHIGQPVTFNATVSSHLGAIPDGEPVRFFDGNNLLHTAPLSSGRAAYTTRTLSVGRHNIKAVYPGDVTFGISCAVVLQVVQK
jgi:hypothetical protein